MIKYENSNSPKALDLNAATEFCGHRTERLLRVGSIRVTTTDVSTPSLEIEAIRGARGLREELRKSIEACRERKGVRVAELE